MPKRASTNMFLVVATAFLAAGCSSSNSTGDGATPADDAGQPGQDAAMNTNDGATSPEGSPGVDSGGKDSGSVGKDGGGGGVDSGGGGVDSGSGAGPIKTVFLIVMENHNWSDIKGNAATPYINSLLAQGAHAENYFDNPKAIHPSEPNYLWLEAGDNLGLSGSDPLPAAKHYSTTAHLVTLLTNAGISWHAYVEDIAAGACPLTNQGLFAPKHTPMLFFDDIIGNPLSTSSAPCVNNVVPYTQLATDLAGGSVARYNFITPNLCDDMHNSGCIPTGDTWLSNEVPKILSSAAYANNGALFITWDESEGGEFPIGMIVLSPKAKVNYSNSIKYFHSSMLRTTEEILGVTPLLGDAANQPSLSDMFTSYP